MEASWQSNSPPWSLTGRRIELIAAMSTLGMLLLTATILWSRRLVGGFAESPSATVLFATGFVLVGSSFLLRIPLFRDEATHRTVAKVLIFGTSVTFVVIGALLTDVVTQPWWAWITFWLAMIGAESLVYGRLAPQFRFHRRLGTRNTDVLVDESELPEGVCQKFVRSIDPELGEIIHGTWRAQFQAGQRTASIHLSFCPPLAGSPQLDVETVSGPAASTKPALVVPHGARIDIRLEQPAEQETDVVLEVFVHQG